MYLHRRAGMRPSPRHTPYLMDTQTRRQVMVPAQAMAWGGRLTAHRLRAAGVDEATVRRYAGMVKIGRPRHSGYLTFRIMAEGQSGWVIPAKPGLNLAQKVAAQINEQAIADKILSGLNLEKAFRPQPVGGRHSLPWWKYD